MMPFTPVEAVLVRCAQLKDESDRDHFDGIMYAGEALLKLATLGYVACMDEDRHRTRYSVLHALVRADGVGRWAEQLAEVVQGAASAALNRAAHPLQNELVARHGAGTNFYAYVHSARSALRVVSPSASPAETKVQLLSVFRDFAAIRNATRGHGAYDAVKLREVAEFLSPVIDGLAKDLGIFKLQWVHLFQNLSGKYRVTRLSDGDTNYAEFRRKAPSQKLSNGVSLWLDGARHVDLVEYDLERGLTYLPNGGFNGKRFELLCYSTGDKDVQDAANFLTPPGQLPDSETASLRDLRVMGECLTNAPPIPEEYIARPHLESELISLIADDRHPIITLQGRGGIGKTSATLKVLNDISGDARFGQICWFSARDIDLLPQGPKRVRADSITVEGFAETYCSLFASGSRKGSLARQALEAALGRKDGEASLFVFDNFETVAFPLEVYEWIDTHIRLPNKALITTRIREFRGDWPVDVLGMEYDEAKALVNSLVVSLRITRAPSQQEFDLLFDESGGHPYIIRIMMGDFASTGRMRKIGALATKNEELLNALFERTYAQLPAGAVRVFLTCASWNSVVPVAALKAVLLTAEADGSLDVERAVEALRLSSLLELHRAAADNHELIYVPLIAQGFARAKLMLSPYRAAVEADLKVLHAFGSVTSVEQARLSSRISRFVKYLAVLPNRNEDSYARGRRVLEILAQGLPEVWLTIAQLELEGGSGQGQNAAMQRAREAIGSFLQATSVDSSAFDKALLGKAWLDYFRLSQHLEDEASQINALLGIARSRTIALGDLSRIASDYNRLLASQGLHLDAVVKDSVTEELASALDSAIRLESPSAIDHSRLAWLYLRLNRESDALNEAEKGLRLNPADEHCTRLREKLAGGGR